jgi:transcriptional regulator with XRE-family HTH domain
MADMDTTVRTVLGDNVKRIRNVRELTVRDLSARLKQLGLSLSPSGVSEVENAARKIAVDELLVFAIALNTSVIDLLMPPDGEPLSVAEGFTFDTGPLYLWLQGEGPWLPDAASNELIDKSGAEFIEAARDYHKRMWWRENGTPAEHAATILGVAARFSPDEFERYGCPGADALPPALDQMRQHVEALIARTDKAENDGG